MHAIYILARLLQVSGWLAGIAGVTLVWLDLVDSAQVNGIDGIAIVGGACVLLGYVACLCARGLDHCLRHTPWIEVYEVSV